MLNKIKNRAVYIGALLIAVFALVSGVVAYTGQNNGTVIESQVIQGDYVSSSLSEEPTLGAFPGTDVTLDNIEIGGSRSGSLTFTAGATTTPGGLFRSYNAGPDKICTEVIFEIATADTTNGRLGTGVPLAYVVGTSTLPTAWSGAGSSLISSTTNATGTTEILSSRTTGSLGTGVAVAGQSWLWKTGEYILGAFDSIPGDAATSSEGYTGSAGEYYVDCIVR